MPQSQSSSQTTDISNYRYLKENLLLNNSNLRHKKLSYKKEQ